MELEELLILKEEIPILDNSFFAVPIHPKLISPDIKLDEKLANKLFPQAAEDWYNDLKEYVKTLEDDNEKEWINRVFLNKKISIEEDHGYQKVNPPGHWEDSVFIMKNGFASSLSIHRDFGGSIYIDLSHPNFLGHDIVKFSPEKFLEFRCRKNESDGDGSRGILDAHVYHQHNVDEYPGALFLRNWAILYVNEALKQIF